MSFGKASNIHISKIQFHHIPFAKNPYGSHPSSPCFLISYIYPRCTMVQPRHQNAAFQHNDRIALEAIEAF